MCVQCVQCATCIALTDEHIGDIPFHKEIMDEVGADFCFAQVSTEISKKLFLFIYFLTAYF